MLWLLHTEHGYGKKRLATLLHQIIEFCEQYVAPGRQPDGAFSGLTLEDLAQALLDECQIKIDAKRGLIDIEGIELKEDTEE